MPTKKPISQKEAEKLFNTYIDKQNEMVKIESSLYFPSDILKCISPVTYSIRLVKFIDEQGINLKPTNAKI